MLADIAPLQMAVNHLSEIFKSYSGKEGDPSTLTKGELHELFNKELLYITFCQHIHKHQKGDQSEIDKVFHILDEDRSGTVDFKGFATVYRPTNSDELMPCSIHLQSDQCPSHIHVIIIGYKKEKTLTGRKT